MAESDVQIVAKLLPGLDDGLDMRDLVEDDAFWEGARELIEADAEVRFILQSGGSLGAMGGPFRGSDGFRARWREWLEPWEQLRIVPVELLDAGESRVLFLAELHGRLRVQAGAAVYHLRDGTIAGIDHYLDHEQARRAAGLN